MKRVLVVSIATMLLLGCSGSDSNPTEGGQSELHIVDVTENLASTPESKRLRFFKEIHVGDEIADLNVTGKNQRVVIMGEMADASHPELINRIHKQYNTFSKKGEVLEGNANQAYMIEKYSKGDGHGTHIAGTIAAECDKKGMQGVACKSTIDIYDIGVYGNENIPVEGWGDTHQFSIFLSAFASAMDDVTQKNESKVTTGSFNIEAPYIEYNLTLQSSDLNTLIDKIGSNIYNSNLISFTNEADKEYLKKVTEANDDETIPLMTLIQFSKEWNEVEDAIKRYQDNDGVYISTESNNIFNRTSLLNAMPTISNKVDKDLWINAVLVSPKGFDEANLTTLDEVYNYIQTHEYINMINDCGKIAKEYCMVVPSYSILSSVTKKLAESQELLYGIDGRYYQTYTGHSMGAPMIAGALALMKEYNEKHNKGYSTKDLVRILKESANKSFKGYDPNRHGVGMLDVKAALAAM